MADMHDLSKFYSHIHTHIRTCYTKSFSFKGFETNPNRPKTISFSNYTHMHTQTQIGMRQSEQVRIYCLLNAGVMPFASFSNDMAVMCNLLKRQKPNVPMGMLSKDCESFLEACFAPADRYVCSH